jgi:hypothetical protein
MIEGEDGPEIDGHGINGQLNAGSHVRAHAAHAVHAAHAERARQEPSISVLVSRLEALVLVQEMSE